MPIWTATKLIIGDWFSYNGTGVSMHLGRLALTYERTDGANWMERLDAVCLAVSSIAMFPSLMQN